MNLENFKFKIWNSCYKRFISNSEVDLISLVDNKNIINFLLYKEHIYWPSQLTAEAKDIEILMYSGLKDKNNNEIYEGDILSFPDGPHPKTIVTYEFGCFIIYSQVLLMDMHKASVIIGNVFENFDLLEHK